MMVGGRDSLDRASRRLDAVDESVAQAREEVAVLNVLLGESLEVARAIANKLSGVAVAS